MKFSTLLTASFLALSASALPTSGQGLPALNERAPCTPGDGSGFGGVCGTLTDKQRELGLALDKRSRPAESAKDIALGEATDKRSRPAESAKDIALGEATDKRSRPVESAKDIALGEATDKRSRPVESAKDIALGEATDKRASGSDVVAQLQSTFDRNNPNGTPANGSEDDLNGDGVINAFEAGAQAD